MKYFLRWSERKHCWEMCARPERAGYESVIVGHLSLEDMDRIINRELLKETRSVFDMDLKKDADQLDAGYPLYYNIRNFDEFAACAAKFGRAARRSRISMMLWSGIIFPDFKGMSQVAKITMC